MKEQLGKRSILNRLVSRIKDTSLMAWDPESRIPQMWRVYDCVRALGAVHRDEIAYALGDFMSAHTVSSRLDEAINYLGILAYLADDTGKTRRNCQAHRVSVVPGMVEAWGDPQYETQRAALYKQADVIDAAYKTVRDQQQVYLDILDEWQDKVLNGRGEKRANTP